MAQDLLSILITTVASESSFSTAFRIFNMYRSHPMSKNVEALICIRNWLHGFNDDGEEEDDKDGKVEPTFSKGASNVLDVEDDNGLEVEG
ncbi:hypothetical protein CR513_23687, partial [Mucuna pruriens]